MPDLEPAVERALSELSDEDWSALTARVRPPTSAAQLRDVAGKLIAGDRLEAFVAVADLKALAAENGDIDETKVTQAVTTLFGLPHNNTHEDFGQFRQPPPMPGPGEAGRAEAQRRFATAGGHTQTRPTPQAGAGGRREAERRFGGKERS